MREVQTLITKRQVHQIAVDVAGEAKGGPLVMIQGLGISVFLQYCPADFGVRGRQNPWVDSAIFTTSLAKMHDSASGQTCAVMRILCFGWDCINSCPSLAECLQVRSFFACYIVYAILCMRYWGDLTVE